jgi:hypothetical protein
VTFGLGIGQDSGIQANSSEETALLRNPVHVSTRQYTHACPNDLPVVDVIGDALANALLRALNAGDYETYTRVKAKLDAWREGLS